MVLRILSLEMISSNSATIKVKAIMKRIYSILFAATALFAAASCQKEMAAPEVESNNGEVMTITATTGVDTKTTLDGVSTLWEADDQISVFDANKEGNNRCFGIATGAGEKTATFSYDGDFVMDDTQADPTVVALYPYQAGAYCDFFYYDRNYITGINLPAEQTAVANGFDSSATFAIALGTMSTKDALSFKNLYSLLKFTVATAGVKSVAVTVEGENAYIAGDAKIQMVLNTELVNNQSGLPVFESPVLSVLPESGSKTVTLTCEGGFKVGTTYYIAVAPTSYTGISVALDGKMAMKSTAAKTLEKNTVYNLGKLAVPETWGICGTFTGNWDITQSKTMTYNYDGWYVLEGVEIYKDDEFKFVANKSWTVSLGNKDAVLVAEVGKEYSLTESNGQNIKVNKNGVFTLSLNPTDKKFKLECTEEYTDLKVTITVDNKANWSPLYIYLESNGTAITAATGDLVTDNKYQVSGDYIGSSLSYKFISGDKVSDVSNVTITRNGTTVTLEENVIKLKVQLDTDNAKQWWGSTMKIHVWNTGTSFDTSWPGTTMTSEGNYTWSVIVPSELVGKTIKYLVHNGNGWQSKDSQLTISASGNTVKGSAIGVK